MLSARRHSADRPRGPFAPGGPGGKCDDRPVPTQLPSRVGRGRPRGCGGDRVGLRACPRPRGGRLVHARHSRVADLAGTTPRRRAVRPQHGRGVHRHDRRRGPARHRRRFRVLAGPGAPGRRPTGRAHRLQLRSVRARCGGGWGRLRRARPGGELDRLPHVAAGVPGAGAGRSVGNRHEPPPDRLGGVAHFGGSDRGEPARGPRDRAPAADLLPRLRGGRRGADRRGEPVHAGAARGAGARGTSGPARLPGAGRGLRPPRQRLREGDRGQGPLHPRPRGPRRRRCPRRSPARWATTTSRVG